MRWFRQWLNSASARQLAYLAGGAWLLCVLVIVVEMALIDGDFALAPQLLALSVGGAAAVVFSVRANDKRKAAHPDSRDPDAGLSGWKRTYVSFAGWTAIITGVAILCYFALALIGLK